MELDLFPQNQLETYIDRVWTYYTKKNLLVTVNGRDYTGLVHGEGPNKGLFVFEPPTGYGLRPVMIKNPNTNSRVGFISGFKDVYECQIQLDVVPPKPLPADSGDIARDLGAGFLRSTLGVGVIHGVDFDRLPACDQIVYAAISMKTRYCRRPTLLVTTMFASRAASVLPRTPPSWCSQYIQLLAE
jgi:hypothetical protein